MSEEAKDLIDKLLTFDQTKRLGSVESTDHRYLTDANLIKQHVFFKGIDWQNLLSTPPPTYFVPKPADPTDTSYFWGIKST